MKLQDMTVIADRLYELPGFQKSDLDPQDKYSNTAIIKWDGRYPGNSGEKTRNLASNMFIFVLKGSVTLYFLRGQGSVQHASEGDIIFVPNMKFYIWQAHSKVVTLNKSTPAWTPGQQDVRAMTHKDRGVLERLYALE